MKFLAVLFCLVVLPMQLVAEPLYPNSVASNDLDFILTDDPGTCWTMTEKGGGRTEMYDPRRDTLFVEGAIHFDVDFPDQVIRLNLHPEVSAPKQRAMQVAASISKLPEPMRAAILYVNILDGDGSAWEEGLGGFFTLYDDLMQRRLAQHDLDETVFHEAAHIAFDATLSKDPGWRSSQRADPAFVTRYAAEHPDKEDIAETALFAWNMLHHPGRLPAEVEAAVRKTVPNRLQFLANVMMDFYPPKCRP